MLGKNRGKLCYLLLAFVVLYVSFGTDMCNAQDKSDDVKTLLKKRRDLLSEIATQTSQLYSTLRNVTLQEAIQADRDSLKADLDWYDKPEDRIKAIEEHKKAADDIVKVAERRFAAGRDLNHSVLQARAYALEIQIELLKEKKRTTPDK